MACACDSLSPLHVEETAIMGTWRALANAFSPCLMRKRQSWGACDSLFPLPVEEKDCRGTLQGSVAGVRTELRRALKGSAGLHGASSGTLQGSVAGVRTELRRALNGSAGLRGAS